VKAWKHRWNQYTVAVIAITMTALVHSAMDTTREDDPDRIFLPEAAHAQLGSLGFDTVLADYYWLEALQLVGGERGDTARHVSMIGEMVDLITTLDPWVSGPYGFAAVWMTDSKQSVVEANRLLARGIAHNADDWRSRYYLGFNYFFYLEEYEKAADAFESAMPIDGAPYYLGALVARLRMSEGSLDMAADFLAELARTSVDEYQQAEFLKALDEIETERRARVLDAAREEYRRRNGEDLREIGDLLRGPAPILTRLPPAHPHFDFPVWRIDEATGEIVSSYYRSRYRLHRPAHDDERRERWRKGQEPGVRAS